jgi:glycosyltransferase involved in cell wall biosynthesis
LTNADPQKRQDRRRRTRVVFVLPSFNAGGAQRISLTLLSHLDTEDFDSHLITFSAQGPLRPLCPANITLHDLNTRRLRRSLIPLLFVLRQLRPDVIFSTMGYANLAVLALRPLLPGHPRIVIRESNTPSASLPTLAFSGTLKVGYRWLYPKADVVISQSRRMTNELTASFCVEPSRLVEMRNPQDVSEIRAKSQPSERLDGEGLRFVAAGRLVDQKGFDRLISMVAKLPSTAKVLILGDGPNRGDLERLARQEGVDQRVHFAGYVENPYPWLAGADSFLLPSRWEGMPNAALEALACGTPVIGTPEAGGLEEIAALAPAAAVTVAAVGDPFLVAMQGVKAADLSRTRVSLLPREFEQLSVVQQFSDLLAGRLSSLPPQGHGILPKI